MSVRERLLTDASGSIMLKPSETVDVVGTAFDRISEAGTMDRIQRAVQYRQRLWIVTGNVHYVMRAHRDPEFAALISHADLRVADGVPILWAARLLGQPLCGRVNGTDLVWRCAEVSAKSGCTVALVGAAPRTAKLAADKLTAMQPGARVVVIPTPRPLTNATAKVIADGVRAAGADIVLVALGAGLQDRWIDDHAAHSAASVFIGIGGALDIISGQITRAPHWMQHYGLEWLFRLSREPGRLWRRYLWEDAPFVWLVLRDVLLKRFRPRAA